MINWDDYVTPAPVKKEKKAPAKKKPAKKSAK